MSKLHVFEPFFWVYFAWYYLPFLRGLFNTNTCNYFFFSLFLIGCVLVILELFSKKRIILLKYSPVYPVVFYIITMSCMAYFNIADATSHIKVSFTFWGTLIIFYLLENHKDARRRLGRVMLGCFIVTFFTSMKGVITNPKAARLLTFSLNAQEEDIALKLMNIAGLAFFQCLVIMVPILVTGIQKNKRRLICVIALAFIIIALVKASFTIAFTMFFVAILLGIYFNNSKSTKLFFLIMSFLIFSVIPMGDVLIYLSEVIQNPAIQARLFSLGQSLANYTISGKLTLRFELYHMSISTFLANPFGVGPQYSYILKEAGIGYHSQILDDLARYGIFAMIFYIMFFIEYRHLLIKQWAKVNWEHIVDGVVLLYLIFLTLNPGFTSSQESVMMLFLLPVLPEIICRKSIMKRNEVVT